jgi:hypothetical protein
MLQLQPLGRRLHDQLAASKALKTRRRAQPLAGRGGVGLAPAVALGALGQRDAHAIDPGCKRAGVGVVKACGVAAQRRELGDPGAHRARAGDAHRGDVHAGSMASRSGGSSPSQ